MGHGSKDVQLIAVSGQQFVEAIRGCGGGGEVPASLNDVIAKGRAFQAAVERMASDSFVAIARSVERLAQSCLRENSAPNALERETLQLAADWLEQLILLRRAGLPEPGALVNELLYTFELLGRSHDAQSLAELFGTAGNGTEDLFDQDPEPASEVYKIPKDFDPFVDDPGFGVAFDLLQRTLTLRRGATEPDGDLFADDDAF